MDAEATVMLIGLGGLGGVTLELLAREEGIDRIIVGSKSTKGGEERCNLARMGAMAQGYSPDIQFLHLDINNIDATADTIFRVSPQIVLSTASRLTWWLSDLFPEEQQKQLNQIGFGAWLPVHLDLAMKLMQSLKLLSYKGHVIIASYPDVVNTVLKARGLTPTTGVGNLDEVVPKIRLLGAEKLGVTPGELQVTLVAHHALEGWVYGDPGGQPPPYYLKVKHEGQDVTKEVEAEELLFAPYRLPSGPAWHFLSAGSATRMVKALLSKEKVFLHAPGPLGFPGGYPIHASKQGIALALPPELSLEEAVRINQASHPFDGIQSVEADGTVIFCQESVEILHQVLGYECERLLPWETEFHAQELIQRFQEYAVKNGVNLPGIER